MRTRIRALRKARGWSQQELAARADMRQATVSKAESSPVDCEMDTFERLAAALGVPLADLFVPAPGEVSAMDLLRAFEKLGPQEREAVSRHALALAAAEAGKPQG